MKYFRLITICICLTSCLTPIDDFQPQTSQSFLTIEASLTDQTENNKVKIYYSSNLLFSTFSKPIEFTPVTKAKVFYTDEKGIKEELKESQTGTYQTSSQFVGKIGSIYTLSIEFQNGEKYVSLPETMKAVPEIENLITRFEINDIYDKKDPKRAGFIVYLDFKDSEKQGDNYQWYWKNYEKINICETCVGAPFDFRLNTCRRSSSDKVYNYSCDGNCWNVNFSTDLNLLSDVLLNGQRITGKQVARIPYDSPTPYYLQLEQRALTQNAYNYYKNLKTQTQDNGTLFDVPAETRFNFNIKSTTNPQEKILGIFDVYSFKKIITYIDRQQIAPKNELPVYKLNGGEFFGSVPCAEGINRTKIKPPQWKE